MAVKRNNPGNIRPSAWTKGQPGYVGDEGGFAVFDTPESGQQAMLSLLGSYTRRGHNTLDKIVNRWAPPSDNNPTNSYVAYVAEKTGLDPNAEVTPEALNAIAQAMAEFETGTKAPLKFDDTAEFRLPDPAPLTVPGNSASRFDEVFGAPAADGGSPSDMKSRFDEVFGNTTLQDALKAASDINPLNRPAGDTPKAEPNMLDQLVGSTDAFLRSGVNAIPVVGPALTGFTDAATTGLNNLLSGIPGADRLGIEPTTMAGFQQTAEANQQANPIASGAGWLTGTVAPLAGAGMTALGGKLLGTSATSTLPANMVMGGLSSAGLGYSDSLARGASPQDAGTNALLAAGLGSTVPVLSKAMSAAWNAVKGPSSANVLGQAMAADSIGPTQANALLKGMGPDAMVADLGPNLQGLAGGLASVPGKAQATLKNALLDRAGQAGERLKADLAATLGQGAPAASIVADITKAQKAAAAPLYAAVESVPVKVTPELEALLDTPMGKKAIDQAGKMMANDRVPVDFNVKLFDYVKRALDDTIEVAKRTGENNVARQATSLTKDLVAAVDSQVPEYATARAAFAGPAAIKDAVEYGTSVLNKGVTPDELSATFGAMSPSEKDAVLAGVRDAVARMVGTARNDAVTLKNAFASDYSKEKLAILLGDDVAKQIEDALSREAAFEATNRLVTGNSLTASRLAMQRQVAPEVATPHLSRTFAGVILDGIEKARQLVTGSYRGKVNAKIADALTQATMKMNTAPPNALLAPAAPVLAAQRTDNPNWLWSGKPKALTAGP